MKKKKLLKAKDNIVIDGVCAGMANYFDLDVTLVRVGWIIFCCLGGSGIIGYFLCMIIMPREK